VRFGTVSGTSAAAAVAAGAAALLAEGRPTLSAVGLHGVLVGSAERSDLDPTSSGAGLVNLRQAVDGIPGADESLAHSARNEYGSGGPAKNFERELSIDCGTSGVFVRPDGEGRRHARQQRRVAKALSGLEDIHNHVLVTELD
jgi:hypothetical protein